MKLAAVVVWFFIMPLADASEMAPPALASAVQQLRQAAGLWNVTTTQYRRRRRSRPRRVRNLPLRWIVPDRVLAGRSDIPDWGNATGILFYVNERRSTIEMASVGSDGQVWVMTGPANSETRMTPDTPLADGRKMKRRFTRSNVSADRFESRMEVSLDGGENWKPGNHQLFRRAPGNDGDSGSGLRFRKRAQPYVPLT